MVVVAAGGWGGVNRKGCRGLLEAHWNIISLPGDLFRHQEIHSSERAVFIIEQGHHSDFTAHTHTRTRKPGSDGLMCYLCVISPSSLRPRLPPVLAVAQMYA